ncbi:hypothetical protein B4U79_03884 [Dinothrombium tinctorium]|uniref:Uncharacterized protein n=1 Tax=Dinothrombium tinctorium TaxID=1965070 RepID=A0A3S3PZ42_9ACAR|nr:hypothetical protein B4U79_02417 [Dinothrombium tinctorium]RWS10806.1 hypothetical protein B4U79_01571 [Dinothrombium tinctorium]RWS17017.1 hypothetical protein B4U79_03884 [Dinothrombium tinctorium]
MKIFILLVAFAFFGFSESQRPASGAEEFGPPKPYNFEYKNQDPDGNQQYHSESGDQNGEKRGTFGYQLADGVFRQVDYTAGAGGFKPIVRTNEPGTGKHENGDPADTVYEVQPPPPGVVPPEGASPASPARRPARPAKR